MHLPVGVIPIITVRNAFQVFVVRPYARGKRVELVTYKRWTPDVRCFHLSLIRKGRCRMSKKNGGKYQAFCCATRRVSCRRPAIQEGEHLQRANKKGGFCKVRQGFPIHYRTQYDWGMFD